ncbi:MAG: HAD-IA family hydrolase [Terracidiphilus sp.]|jgi:putative hydrolase of the HAD superfamily
MFPFDAILFDVGGVLLTNGWDHRERALVLQQFHLDRDGFEARNPAPYSAWESGAITADAYLKATVFNEPRDFTPEEFLAAMCAQSALLENGALGILKELAASDKCLLGALNNEARETNEFRFERFGLRPLFRVTMSSCYLGLRKPDVAIYLRALDILGRPAERILFIDDRAGNVAGAEAAGIKAILFEGANSLRAELGRLGVLE